LFAGIDVAGFDKLDGALPIVAEAEFARGLFHFGFAPGELALADGEDLFRRVGDHFGTESGGESVAADGVADDCLVVVLGETGEVLAEEFAVAGKGSVEGFVRFGEPPGEEGIVFVVEVMPVLERTLQFGGCGSGAEGFGGGGLGALGLRLGEPLDHFAGLLIGLRDAAGGGAWIEWIDAFAGFAEIDDGGGEGEKRSDRGDAGAAFVHQLEALIELEAKRQVFGAAVDRERFEGNLVERTAPG